MNLLDKIKKSDGAKTANLTAAFFNATNMPVPDKGEYTITADKGFLVFLDEPACVMRGLGKNHVRKRNAPNLLAPLLSKDCGKISIGIYPGVRSPITTSDSFKLLHMMWKQGYTYYDVGPYNGGYLPLSTPKFPKGVPVVIDQAGLYESMLSIWHIKKLLDRCGIMKMSTTEAPQDDLYKNLREHFEAAWPENQEAPNQDLLHKAWQLCRQKAQQVVTLASGERTTLLTADWINAGQKGKPKANFKNAKYGGETYAKRWQISKDI